ncbi:hypothetical protein H9P43_004060 [Blastocladiella emersonii ATCC 22665]|nr:hypothetical protein H9P43_004060 [Blastocladiella emersonii ATCC 22665]
MTMMIDTLDPSASAILISASSALRESYLGALWCPVEAFRARVAVDATDAPVADPAPAHARWTAVRGAGDTPLVVRAITAPAEGSGELLADLVALAAFAAAHRHVVGVSGIAANGADKGTLLVATPAGNGSLAALLRKWDVAARETASGPATTASPTTNDTSSTAVTSLGSRAALNPATMPLTPRLALSWFRDMLEGVLVWHARTESGERLSPTFTTRALRLTPEYVYVSSPDLRAQIDVAWMCDPDPAMLDSEPENPAAFELQGLSDLLSQLQRAMALDLADPAAENLATDLLYLVVEIESAAEDPDLVDAAPAVQGALESVCKLLAELD